MLKALLVFIVLLLLLAVGGGAFLVSGNVAPPATPVEKVIPNDRFKG